MQQNATIRDTRGGYPWPQLATLTLLALIAYLPAFRAGYIWDDDQHITNSSVLTTPGGLADIWFKPSAIPQYYPLTHTLFWIEYHLWGLHPTGYHAVSVLLHIAVCLLLWKLLALLPLPGSFLIACLFAVHPIQVETVAWASEQKTLLSALFYLLSFITWLRHIDSPKKRRLDLLALAFFICALLSKTIACSLPCAMLLVLWWRKTPIRSAIIWSLAPYFLIGMALGELTAYLEVHRVQAQGPEWALSPIDRILIAGRAWWFYIAKLIWPAKLSFNYPRWDINPRQPWQWIPPISALATLLTLFAARNRIGRGPIACLMFFTLTLVPALGFFNLYPMRYSFVADHFVYLASAGIVCLIASRLPAVIGWAFIPVLIILTFLRCQVFVDDPTLWRDVLSKYPNSAIAHFKLGREYAAAGDLINANQQFIESAQDGPLLFEPRLFLAYDYYHLHQPAPTALWYAQARRLRPELPAFQDWLGLLQSDESPPEDSSNSPECPIILRETVLPLLQAPKPPPSPTPSHAELGRILRLQVPVIVKLAERKLSVHEVMRLGAGAIIEFFKASDQPLDLLINNKVVATGEAVKVGENFGLRITQIADVKQVIQSLGS